MVVRTTDQECCPRSQRWPRKRHEARERAKADAQLGIG